MRNLRWGQKRASHTDNKKVFFRCTLFLVVVVADVDVVVVVLCCIVVVGGCCNPTAEARCTE